MTKCPGFKNVKLGDFLRDGFPLRLDVYPSAVMESTSLGMGVLRPSKDGVPCGFVKQCSAGLILLHRVGLRSVNHARR